MPTDDRIREIAETLRLTERQVRAVLEMAGERQRVTAVDAWGALHEVHVGPTPTFRGFA